MSRSVLVIVSLLISSATYAGQNPPDGGCLIPYQSCLQISITNNLSTALTVTIPHSPCSITDRVNDCTNFFRNQTTTIQPDSSITGSVKNAVSFVSGLPALTISSQNTCHGTINLPKNNFYFPAPNDFTGACSAKAGGSGASHSLTSWTVTINPVSASKPIKPPIIKP